MKKRGFVRTILELISWILIFTIVLSLTTELVFTLVAIVFCGISTLIFDKIEAKGVFSKVDNYLSETRFFIFCSKYKQIITIILLVIGIIIMLMVFS